MKKLIYLFTIIFILTGCSLFNRKKELNIIPEEVVNAIEIDNTFLLNNFFSEDFLVSYRDKNGKSLLMIAIENDSQKTLDMILTRGIDLEEEIENDKTPIFYVRSLDALNKLVIAGADINKKDNKNESLLSYFIKNKPLEYSEYLVLAGAELNIGNDVGWTPVFDAVVLGNIKLINLLLEKGGDFNKEDIYGNIPIFYTSDEEVILKLLEIKKYDLKYGLLKKNKKNENIFGEIYLKAVSCGNIRVIERLLELGVNPYYMSYGDSAMSIAREKNNLEMIKFLKNKNLK